MQNYKNLRFSTIDDNNKTTILGVNNNYKFSIVVFTN